MKECREHVQQLGISTRVSFLGYKRKPWNCVSPGSVFVLSSAFEGFAIAVLEAMACGHLCILPNIGPLEEMFERDVHALFYETNELTGLIAAMRSALQLPRRQSDHMITAARRRVQSAFDARRMANEYFRLYSQLCAGKQLSGGKRSRRNELPS
jgi:glycosyltransferase involved in cell wall biosynthesis